MLFFAQSCSKVFSTFFLPHSLSCFFFVTFAWPVPVCRILIALSMFSQTKWISKLNHNIRYVKLYFWKFKQLFFLKKPWLNNNSKIIPKTQNYRFFGSEILNKMDMDRANKWPWLSRKYRANTSLWLQCFCFAEIKWRYLLIKLQ